MREGFGVYVQIYDLCDVHHHLNDLVKVVSFVHAPKYDHVASCIHDLALKSSLQVWIRHLLSNLEREYRNVYDVHEMT